MANYETLKAAIAAAIKRNGNNEITGNLLQQQLLAMVNSLGANYQFVDIATPSTNPGTPDQNVFYIATTPGTYSNFSGKIVVYGEIAILSYNGTWAKKSINVAPRSLLTNIIGYNTDENMAIRASDGAIVPQNGMACTPKISVDSVKYIRGIVYDNTHAGTIAGLAWYDENGAFLSIYDKTTGSYYDGNNYFPILDIAKSAFPANAKYFAVTFYGLAIDSGMNFLDLGGIFKQLSAQIDNVATQIENVSIRVDGISQQVDDVSKSVSPIITKTVTLQQGQLTFILTPEEIANMPWLKDRVSIIVREISGTLNALDFSYYSGETLYNYNTGPQNNYRFVKNGKFVLFDVPGATLHRIYCAGAATTITGTVTLTIDIFNDTNAIPEFVPDYAFVLPNHEMRMYPQNLIGIDNRDFHVGIIGRCLRSNENFCRILPNDVAQIPIELKTREFGITYEKRIGVITVNKNAPQSPYFILPIGDSLTYGANMAYHGCYPNELSRLFNGIGTEIANGAQPLGWENVHVIGTLGDQPIKHEGRGGWSVETYLTTAAGNAFWNPSTQKFDLNYYLSQNGFYAQGVSANGSNLAVMLFLNWNSDPADPAFVSNYEILIANIHASHPNAKIFIVGCPCPPQTVYLSSGSNPYNALQSVQKNNAIMYENKIAAMCDKYNYCIHIPLLPFFSWEKSYSWYDTVAPVPRDPSNKITIYADSHHPNLVGYGQIADIMLAFLCYYCF